ncbi:MAG: hypothetical protein EHM24_28740 [Acidobacteria bacterium]|nr:MAG: hypothetical protein EHM24_28740 [Acidobacteriota bacterium]RPJ82548.1 MAG: hypothetical protein EHM13_08765 [Acidobacteriota bacterium]
MTADVFQSGWASLPVPAGLRVSRAEIDGRPVSLLAAPDGRGGTRLAVLLSREGRSLVTLDVSLPVASKAAIESLVLPPSPAAVQRLAIELPGQELALNVTGGFVAETAASGRVTRFSVSGRPNEPMTLSWGRRRETPAASEPLRFRGTVTEVVGLGEEASQVSAQVAVEILQGTTDRLSLRVPDGFAVGQLSGPLVADWESSSGEVLVTLLEPSGGPIGVTVTGESRAPRDGKIPVPFIRLAGAERETGGVAVEVLGAGEITSHSASGIDRTDSSELGELIRARQSPALLAFRLRPQSSDAPRALDVTVVRYATQAVLLANVQEARYTALLAEDGKGLVEAVYAIRNSQRSFVAITLPPSATLWSATVDGRPTRPGHADGGALLLPILKEKRGTEAVSVVKVTYAYRGDPWRDGQFAALQLPAPDLPVSRSGLVVHHSPRFGLRLEPGPFRVEAFEPPQTTALRFAPFVAGGSVTGGVEGGVAGGVVGGIVGGLPRAPGAPPRGERAPDQQTLDLVNEYQRTKGGGSVSGLLPIDVPVPLVGPSIYLASELAPEGKALDARFRLERREK